MTDNDIVRIGYTCAYAPLPLIDAAGFAPYRILPLGDCPEQAGGYLHDNLCPHIKRILDRALADDLPELQGLVFIDSCDAMRRVADAMKVLRPKDNITVIDLPLTGEKESLDFFTGRLRDLSKTLVEWGGREITEESLISSIKLYNELAAIAQQLTLASTAGKLPGRATALADFYQRAMTSPIRDTLAHYTDLLSETSDLGEKSAGVPVMLFGNVFIDREGWNMIEDCGARVVADDLCTSGRMFTEISVEGTSDAFRQLAEGLMNKPACARTINPAKPSGLADRIAAQAIQAQARGVIAHVMKFCDPYLARIPSIREALKKADIPLLVIEGDCTLRSLGQQQTRIEAFVEMLG